MNDEAIRKFLADIGKRVSQARAKVDGKAAEGKYDQGPKSCGKDAERQIEVEEDRRAEWDIVVRFGG